MMPTRNGADRLNPEDGFTLVELMVTMVILVIVALMISALLMNGFFTQQSVESTTRSSADAQNTYAALTYDVRYAQHVEIDSSKNLLRTRTWVGEDGQNGSYVCRGWFYDATDQVLRRATTPGLTAGATTASASSWPVYMDYVSAAEPFDFVPEGVAVDFTADPDRRGLPTAMNVVIQPRPQINSEDPACF